MKLIEQQPGISASDVAKTMKIKPNYLYRVLGDLEKEGRVKKDGRNYFPAARLEALTGRQPGQRSSVARGRVPLQNTQASAASVLGRAPGPLP